LAWKRTLHQVMWIQVEIVWIVTLCIVDHSASIFMLKVG
jgi:hypothetical protein